MSAQQTPRMNADSIYVEETFTDQAVGQIRRMSPVLADGGPDTARPVLYFGATQMMTPAGPLPLNFEIEASSLSEAIGKFSDLASNPWSRPSRGLKPCAENKLLRSWFRDTASLNKAYF